MDCGGKLASDSSCSFDDELREVDYDFSLDT
jgi:hypothetical protein